LHVRGVDDEQMQLGVSTELFEDARDVAQVLEEVVLLVVRFELDEEIGSVGQLEEAVTREGRGIDAGQLRWGVLKRSAGCSRRRS
jgi:hypothetical protein